MAPIKNTKVTDGPSKWELMLALFDRKSVNTRQIGFTIEDGRAFEATVLSVEAEDGSGESWNLKGSFFSRTRGAAPNPPVSFEMHFRTDKRQGYIGNTDETDAPTSLVIDCDADPFVPDGWSVEEHQKGGSFEWDASKVELWLANDQKNGKVLEGNKLRKEVAKKAPFNACVLDYLLANPHLIPEEWKSKYVFFWGTVYRSRGGHLSVRYLSWRDGRWVWGGFWLGIDWNGHYPAALRAS